MAHSSPAVCRRKGEGYLLDGKVGGNFKNLFLPGAYDIYAPNGKHYQVPYVYNAVNFWYDKDMMKKAGATPPKRGPISSMSVTPSASLASTRSLWKATTRPTRSFIFSIFSNVKRAQNALVRTFEDKSGESWLKPEVLDAARRKLNLS